MKNYNVMLHFCVKNMKVNKFFRRSYHVIPFCNLHREVTGQTLSDTLFEKLKKKHPNIEKLNYDQLNCTLQILKKFDIDKLHALKDPHVFVMNPLTLDNYGEILKECGFVKIEPVHIIRYHTLVKSRTVAQLKKEGLLRSDTKLEETLLALIEEWPSYSKTLQNFSDNDNSILTIRTNVLQKYLHWKLQVTSDEFMKYCRNYLPLRHRPMSDIQEAIHIAQNEINFDAKSIRRNGFIISADPLNTRLILDNVGTIAGVNIREVIRTEPAILKSNYNSLLEIRNILQENDISKEAQRKCLKVYCMRPDTVKQRLQELRNLKEYQILSSNPRVLYMVIHKRKFISRLNKVELAQKKCYSLNSLVSSSKVFNNYISNFGDKVCGNDIATLISSSLKMNKVNNCTYVANSQKFDKRKFILNQLKRHKYWLHSALSVIDENIRILKMTFNDDIILNNCQLLLYPIVEVQEYINHLVSLRDGPSAESTSDIILDGNYNVLDYRTLSDDHILSLVLYEMEKKYHFSGDGIWGKQDVGRTESVVRSS